MSKSKYWYYSTCYYCPMCGGDRTYKERRYGKKPKDPYKRSKIIESWDGCNA